jgi:acyl carrier protein phosphodiesterase
MNYLAHLFLAESSPESRIGNLLGDFLKGNLEGYESVYSREILEGVKTHRLVDSFSDRHPIYLQSKRRIGASNRRFAGIIIDVCYDHFLTNHWGRFSQQSLASFIEDVYQILVENQKILPLKLQGAIPRMVKEDWLGSYQTLEGISLTLTRIGRRFKRGNYLTDAGEELINNYEEMESDFLLFFPELINFVGEI